MVFQFTAVAGGVEARALVDRVLSGVDLEGLDRRVRRGVRPVVGEDGHPDLVAALDVAAHGVDDALEVVGELLHRLQDATDLVGEQGQGGRGVRGEVLGWRDGERVRHGSSGSYSLAD